MKNNIFTNSLISATIQDGGKRERINDHTLYWSLRIKKKRKPKLK